MSVSRESSQESAGKASQSDARAQLEYDTDLAATRLIAHSTFQIPRDRDCWGITKKGAWCANLPRDGSHYCYHHEGQELL